MPHSANPYAPHIPFNEWLPAYARTIDTAGEDYVDPYTAPEDTRTDYQRFYDYVDKGRFGFADRTLTQGLGALMPGGSIMTNETDRAYGVPNNSSGMLSWLTGTGPLGDWAERKAKDLGNGEGFQPRYGEKYFGPGSKYSAAMGYTGQERQDAIDRFTGLALDQKITDATRAEASLSERGLNYLNSLPLAQQTLALETQYVNALNAKGDIMWMQNNPNKPLEVRQSTGIFNGFFDNWGNRDEGVQAGELQDPTNVEIVDRPRTNIPAPAITKDKGISTLLTQEDNLGYSQNYSEGGGDNFGHGGDSSGYGESASGFGGHEDGTDESDAAAADQGEW